MPQTSRIAMTVAAAAVIALPRVAQAAPPNCVDLPNPLVVEAGDTQEPLLKSLGKKLRDSTSANPPTLIYNLTGSCTLISDFYTSKKLTVNLSYIPAVGDPNALNWDPSMPSPQCVIDPAGQSIDLAISALFVESCNLGATPAGIEQIKGPVQGYSFIVPKASAQAAITAEEAYFVFGFGQAGQVTPWIDETQLFIRPPTKSTLLSLAANIGVTASKWKGVPLDKSTQVLNSVAQSTSAQAALGILGTEVYDQNRDKVSVLAYQAYKQRHAYYPDSTSTSFDKRNLRDGHYTPWSPTVYLSAGSGGTFTNARAKLFTDLVLGNTALADVDGLASVIAKGLVPDCAMKVSRAADGGDLALYSPAAPCGCYYESKVPQGSSSCTACTGTDNTPCGGGVCRHNFCEAK